MLSVYENALAVVTLAAGEGSFLCRLQELAAIQPDRKNFKLEEIGQARDLTHIETGQLLQIAIRLIGKGLVSCSDQMYGLTKQGATAKFAMV